MDNQIDHHAHINFFALFIGALGVAVVSISMFTLGIANKSYAPTPIATQPTITAAVSGQQKADSSKTLTSVFVGEPETDAFYSTITVVPN